MKHPLVHVVWEDAYSTDEWTPAEKLSAEPKLCHSFGVLTKKSKDMIVVAGTIGEGDGDACCVIHLPRGMVKSVTRMREDIT